MSTFRNKRREQSQRQNWKQRLPYNLGRKEAKRKHSILSANTTILSVPVTSLGATTKINEYVKIKWRHRIYIYKVKSGIADDALEDLLLLIQKCFCFSFTLLAFIFFS